MAGPWALSDSPYTTLTTSFETDGVCFHYVEDLGMGIGGWQTTGERTGAMVMVYQYFPDDLSWDNLLVPGYISPGHTFEPGVIMRRLTLEVDASGNHLTARGTFEVYDAAGNLGQSQDVDGWEAGRLIPVPASGATPAS